MRKTVLIIFLSLTAICVFAQREVTSGMGVIDWQGKEGAPIKGIVHYTFSELGDRILLNYKIVSDVVGDSIKFHGKTYRSSDYDGTTTELAKWTALGEPGCTTSLLVDVYAAGIKLGTCTIQPKAINTGGLQTDRDKLFPGISSKSYVDNALKDLALKNFRMTNVTFDFLELIKRVTDKELGKVGVEATIDNGDDSTQTTVQEDKASDKDLAEPVLDEDDEHIESAFATTIVNVLGGDTSAATPVDTILLTPEEQAEKVVFNRLKHEEEIHRIQVAEAYKLNPKVKPRGASIFTLHYALAKKVYGGMRENRWRNTHKGNSIAIKTQLGFGMTNNSIFENSAGFDAVTGKQTTETEVKELYSIDFHGGAEFWPLYGNNAGIGLSAHGQVGHGLLLKNYQFSALFVAKTYVGMKHLKLLGEMEYGTRHYWTNNWLDKATKTQGNSAFTYLSLKVGARLSFNFAFSGKTKAHLDFLPIFQIPSFALDGSQPNAEAGTTTSWVNGFEARFNMENKLVLFGKYFWQYPLNGDVNGTLMSTTANARFVEVGILRTFDYYGGTVYSNVYEKVHRKLKRKQNWILSLFNPTCSGLFSTTLATYNADYKLGIIPIKIETERYLGFNTSVGGGIGLAMFNNGMLGVSAKDETTVFNQSARSGGVYSFKSTSAELPVYVKVATNYLRYAKYWFKLGINNQISLDQELMYADASDLIDQTANLSAYHPNMMYGIGVDYSLSNNLRMTSGVLFQHYISPLNNDENQITPARITIKWGFIL